MSDPVLRPVTDADAEALLRLLTAVEAYDGGHDFPDAGDVAQMLRNPAVVHATDWWVAADGEELVASTRLVPRSPADGEMHVNTTGATRPDHRGRGLGTELLGRVLPAAYASVARRSAELGTALRPVVHGLAAGSDVTASELLVAHGFVPHRWSALMTADLRASGPAVPELPEGYAVTTWEGVDPAELRVAHNRAFDGQLPGFTPFDATLWERSVTTHPSYRPTLSLVVRGPDGDVAAYVHSMERDAVGGGREGFVGNLGTVPGHRHRGLGAAVLGAALARYRDAGLVSAALEVDSDNPSGAKRLYERAGFEERQRWQTFLREQES